jgi:hypothetical protein
VRLIDTIDCGLGVAWTHNLEAMVGAGGFEPPTF